MRQLRYQLAWLRWWLADRLSGCLSACHSGGMSSVKDAINGPPTGLSRFNPLQHICVSVHTHVGRKGRREGGKRGGREDVTETEI